MHETPPATPGQAPDSNPLTDSQEQPPPGEEWTEAEAIKADLAYNHDKAGRAHREQEARALRLQMNDPTGWFD